ncbi:MAG: molybdopterin-dependent oxidoreductase [Spirochaetes bacterium]|nr:molybdopterin-dependent oxidoreductase [Spirochaetota bacterium]
MSYRTGICTFCGTGCGHLLDVRDGNVRGVFPLKSHPVSKGRLCVRGWHVHELLNTNERITKPQIRKDGKLVEVSYDEAIRFFVENVSRLRNEGQDAIGFLGSPRSSNEENYTFMKLARTAFSTHNVCLDSDPGHRNSIDVMHRGTGMAGMLGSLEEIRSSKYIFVIGADITKQNPIIGSEIHMAARNGATVVTMDSRHTQIAKLSNRFLQIRPGTFKMALAYMAKVLIEENLVDSDYIKRQTEGYEAFLGCLSFLKVADVEADVGIDLSLLKETAREICRAPSAMAFFSSGISGFDSDTIGYLYNLFLASGKIGKEGCGVNPVTGISNLQGAYDMGIAPDLLTGYQPVSDASVRDKFNKAWGVRLSARPGRTVEDLLTNTNRSLRALVVVDHDNTVIHHSAELKSVDFIAYVGSFRNGFTDYAHVVLPIAPYIESDGTFTNTERRVQLFKQKRPPQDDVMPGWQLYTAIAAKAGCSWTYTSASDVMDEIAQLTPVYSGYRYDALEQSFGIQWPCTAENPKGTARFSIENSPRKMNFVPTEWNFSVPAASEEYPVLMVVGEAQHYWHQNNLMKKTNIPLREYNATLLLYPRGYVAVSPEDAKALGIRDRGVAKFVSPYGAMEAMVQITDKVKPRTAYVAYFVDDMVTNFFLAHRSIMKLGQDAAIPVRIVKV